MSFSSRKPIKLSDTLEGILEDPKLKVAYKRGMALEIYKAVFSKIVGSKLWIRTVAGESLQKRQEGLALVVRITNPAVRQELHMNRVQFCKALNKRIKFELINTVEFRA